MTFDGSNFLRLGRIAVEDVVDAGHLPLVDISDDELAPVGWEVELTGIGEFTIVRGRGVSGV